MIARGVNNMAVLNGTASRRHNARASHLQHCIGSRALAVAALVVAALLVHGSWALAVAALVVHGCCIGSWAMAVAALVVHGSQALAVAALVAGRW